MHGIDADGAAPTEGAPVEDDVVLSDEQRAELRQRVEASYARPFKASTLEGLLALCDRLTR